MDPNACIDRIISAINDNDLTEARDAIADLDRWLATGGFVPSNGDNLAGLKAADADIAADLRKLRLTIAYPDVRTGAHIHDIANPEAADIGAALVFVRCDDRGDLGVYVWDVSNDEAIEEAEEYAADSGWEVDEDDLAVFAVDDDDRAIVFFRSTLLAE